MKTVTLPEVKTIVKRLGAACRRGELDAAANTFTTTEYQNKDLQAAYAIGRARKKSQHQEKA
jgi:hypothetical protein